MAEVMAEEENVADEGLGDFESILGDAEGGGIEDSGIGGDLDDIFGDEGGGDDASLGGGGDSDLDNFFEDLSTIDDLELHEEEAPAEPEPADDDIEVSAPEPEAEVVTEAPKKEKPKKEKKAKVKKEPGIIGKSVRWLILLAIILAGGYYIYTFFFPNFEMPWKTVQEEKDRLMEMLEDLQKDKPIDQPPPKAEPPKAMEKPADTPPPAVKASKPSVRPAKRVRKSVVERGPWSIQVASCFFPSCLESHRTFLKATKRSVLVRKQSSKSEMLEIYSSSVVSTRERAQIVADRINRNHPLEGNAYVYAEGSGYRISMGAFGDLSRAKVVKNVLNEKFFGDVNFNTRLKTFPYRVNKVLTGKFPSRGAAHQALAKLRIAEPRFKGAFVVRNR